jgi:transcriptional regulator GlxA family with amidase domain
LADLIGKLRVCCRNGHSPGWYRRRGIAKEVPVRGRTLNIGLGAATARGADGLLALFAVRNEPTASLAPDRISRTEHQQTIEALKPRKRERPVIAILALNEGTEVSDLLSTYGVLAESSVADVTVVAARTDPIRLYPTGITAEAPATIAGFDARYPEGADYVVIPAMEPHNDKAIIAWINAQHGKGAMIVSVCDGALTAAAAGLLDGRRATGHWYSAKQLQAKHPTMQWVRDRRYVVDRGVATSTGITASIPLMMALVEAIGGAGAAEKLSMRLGVADWDAGHSSAAFALTFAHRKTFVRNKLSFWRHEAVRIKVDDQVDEIALGLMVDAYARTELAKPITVGGTGGFVQSRRGLRLQPQAPAAAAGVGSVLEPQSDQPARTLDRELERIAARYDRATAAFVALVMEYPWSDQQAWAGTIASRRPSHNP